jgi:hypothetical protein
MATSYTSLLGLALPATGELSGTWGDTVNNYLTSYLDSAVAGSLTVTTDTTLTKTTGSSLGATSSQYAIIIASPASANITITAPAASKAYIINNTSATYTVKIVGAGPTTGVTLAVSEKAIVAWNGSDFVKVGSTGTVTSVTGTSPVSSSGGTTPAISLAASYGDTQNPYASKTANYILAAPNGSAGVPTFRAIVAADIPTLNQNTTGSAATFTSTSQNSQFNSIGVGTAASTTAGEIRATNNVTAYYSDDRLKTRLGDVVGALSKVATLDSFYYQANELAQSLGYEPVREVGISAQQVQAVLPEVVAPAPIDDKYLTVRYERLVPLLIAAIKELKAEIDVLKGAK